MGEHIPAPWRLQRPPHITWDGPSGAFEICGGEDGSIVICQRPWAEGNPVAIQEHEANAHLIVAAPGLLAACEAALKYDAAIKRAAALGKVWVTSGDTEDDLDALYADWMTKTEAAVAQAKGA